MDGILASKWVGHWMTGKHILVYTGLLLPFLAHAKQDFYREQIEQRIAPLGQVRIEGNSDKPSDTMPVKTSTSKTSAGQKSSKRIYDLYCKVCHQNGVAGAPKFHAASDWKPRLSEKGLEGLTTSAIQGLNAMPPKGTCSECTKAEMKAVINYMVGQS